MTLPLAILLYENLLPGTQLGSLLQDLGYRVQTVHDPRLLVEQSTREKPLVAVLDLFSTKLDVCREIKSLKNNSATAHIPVLAFADRAHSDLQKAAYAAGADLVANHTAVVLHLSQFLDQVLQVD
jgi:CheY-like chemotaxis protein